MLITKENAEYFKAVEDRTAEINKKIIKNRVQRLVENMARLLGAANTRGEAFIRKQAKSTKDHGLRNVVARGLAFVIVAYKTDPERGEELLGFCESVFAQLRAEAGRESGIEKLDFWDVDEEQTMLASRRRRAVARCDKQTAREITTRIANTEKRIPMFLKRVEG